VNRVYVCSCFGITEEQVKQHAAEGRCTPRQIASHCKAGTDCGSCVRRIQALLGRGAGCVTRDKLSPPEQEEPVPVVEAVPVEEPVRVAEAVPAPAPVTVSRRRAA
jgi:bacterioferritin-associated ferredoxin